MRSEPRNRLTRALRRLARERTDARHAFGDGRYTIRVANNMESRRKAYRLTYDLYVQKEYAEPHPSKLWLSIFDALPETTTLLVERAGDGEAVGTLTAIFDSPLGLPADDLYRREIDALRASGHRLSEISSLAVAEGGKDGAQVLLKLFNFSYLVARRVRDATDFVITVNPRHVKFYRRKFLFDMAGQERDYGKVGGAPAVLLSIPMDTPDHVVEPLRSRTIYPCFMGVTEEHATTIALCRSLQPMSEAELRGFFLKKTDLLRRAAARERRFIEDSYPFYDLAPETTGTREYQAV